MADLRQFRRAVSILKRKGLIGDRTKSGTPLDARSAFPSWKTADGKSLGKLVEKYDDVVSGKVQPVKVTPKQLARIKRQQKYETAKGLVLVPVDATQKAAIDRDTGLIKTTTRAGIERIKLDIPYHGLHKYLQDIANDAKRINRMKRRSEYWGFQFFGNNSSQLYRDIAHAIEDLQRYESVAYASTRAKQVDIYKNLEIVRVSQPKQWVFPSERRRRLSTEYNRRHQQKFRRGLKRKPAAVRAAYKTANAARVRAWRARLKKSALKAYNKAGAKRAMKSKKAKKKGTRKRK